MGRLLLLFIGLPALELALLIEIGARIGTLATIALIVGTGAIGASLARMQGLGLLREIRREVDRGRLPAQALLDGVIILLASALLITPGVLTDAAGFLCLVPAVRRLVRATVWRRFADAVQEGRVVMTVHMDAPSPYEIEPEDRNPKG
jgi:UPF0716 protein FxsA